MWSARQNSLSQGGFRSEEKTISPEPPPVGMAVGVGVRVGVDVEVAVGVDVAVGGGGVAVDVGGGFVSVGVGGGGVAGAQALKISIRTMEQSTTAERRLVFILKPPNSLDPIG